MSIVLNAIEIRVLGSLVEKESTTPDYYPLSLNALVNACNQKSSRDPVMDVTEDEAQAALRGLQEHRLAGPARGADSRVTKYEHWLQEAYNFTRGESAVLCLLLLRGPQTLGELRGRSERLHRFAELSDVQAALDRLMQREPSLARILPRQPGAKDSRYMHLLAGDELPAGFSAAAEGGIDGSTRSRAAHEGDEERIARLEEQVARLADELAALRTQLAPLLGGDETV